MYARFVTGKIALKEQLIRLAVKIWHRNVNSYARAITFSFVLSSIRHPVRTDQ